MNLSKYIAKRISIQNTNGKKALSSTSNSVLVFSIAMSLLITLIAISVSSGFSYQISSKLKGFAGDLNIAYPGAKPDTEEYFINKDLSYLTSITKLEGVDYINSTLYKPGVLQTTQQVEGVVFKGYDSSANVSFYKEALVEGKLPKFNSESMTDQVLISESMAKIMGYKVGDKLRCYFISPEVRLRSFTISGLYSLNMQELDRNLVIVDMRHIQRLNKLEKNQVSSLELRFDADISNREKQKLNAQIDRIIMNESQQSDSSVAVKRIENIYPQIFDWLNLLDYNVLIIIILMLIVAAFNMVSGLLIILFEKISMIGILKALGMKSFAISKVFIYRAQYLVHKGLIIGNSIFLAIYFLLKYTRIIKLDPANYFIDFVPVRLDFGLWLLVNIIAWLLMILVMLIPSLFISKISPSKTIKMN